MHVFEIFFIMLVAALSILCVLPGRIDEERRRLVATRSLAGLVSIAAIALRAVKLNTWRSDAATITAMAFFFFFFVLRPRPPKTDSAAPVPLPPESTKKASARRVLGALGLMASLASAALLYAFPTRDLKPPTGPYPVGTTTFMITDPTRLGVYLDNPNQARRFMVQAYYPACLDSTNYVRAAWIPDPALALAFASYAGLPSFAMSHLNAILSNSRIDAPHAAGSFPVVIISHGWSGSRVMHVDLAEEMASQGMLVFLTDHPYGALSVRLPDESVLPWDPAALPDRGTNPAFLDKARILVETYADDIVALVSAIRNGSLPDSLANIAAPGKIALAGHSTGGGAAVLAAMKTDGITGVLGLDAWVEPLGELVDKGLPMPQLHLGSQQWRGGFNETWLRRLGKASGSWASYRVEGSVHTDFAMMRHLSGIARLAGWAGTLDGERFATIVNGVSTTWMRALFQGGPTQAESSLPSPGSIRELTRE